MCVRWGGGEGGEGGGGWRVEVLRGSQPLTARA